MQLTPAAFSALSELLRLRAGPANLAAGLVLLDGMRPADAARTAGCIKQTLNYTLRSVERGIELVQSISLDLQGKLTEESFQALGELLRLREGPARIAASLVLVDGMRPADAARLAGCSAQSASNTILVCRRGLDLARHVAAGLSKDLAGKSGNAVI